MNGPFDTRAPSDALGFLAGGGAMGELMRRRDWSASPLGPPKTWPPSLRTIVGLILNSRFPMFAAWGEDLGFLYNDAYVAILGSKHPAALGARFADAWADAWAELSPLVDATLAGTAQYFEDWPLRTHRHGYDEQTWFSFSYSPVADESGAVAGLFCVCTETTGQVRAAQRQAFRDRLDEALRPLADPGSILQTAAETLARALGAERAGYGEFDAEGTSVVMAGEGSGGMAAGGGGQDAVFGPDLVARLQGGRSVAVDDVLRAEPPGAGEAAQAPAEPAAMRASITVPLIEGGRLAAALYAHARSPRRWTPDDEALVRDVAERCRAAVEKARAEQNLRASERELQRLADNLPLLVSFVGADERYVFNNKAYHDWFGHTPGELKGRAVREVVGETAYGLLRGDIARALRGERFAAERAVPYRTGGLREVKVDYVPRFEDGGGVDGYYAIVQDVSDRKRAEAVLRKNEARLRFLDRLGVETGDLLDADALLATTTRLLGEHLGISVCAYADMDRDEDGFTIRGDWAAPGSTSIVGHYSLADFGRLAVRNLGAGLPLVVNDNLAELAPAEAATFRNIGIAATICMPLVKNGRLTALMAIHDRVPRAWSEEELSLLREVTERSWAHVERVGALAELRAGEASLRALNADLERQVIERSAVGGQYWQMSPDLLCVLTAEGYFRNFNPAWSRALGYSEDEIQAAPFSRLVHPDDLEQTLGSFETLVQGNVIPRFENRYRTKSGDIVWIAWAGAPYDDAFYCAGRDVTQEKARAAALVDRTAERDLMAGILATTDAFVHVLDLDYRWLAINRAGADEFERVFGPRPKIGDRMPDLLADQPEHRAAAEALWARALAGEEFTAVSAFGDPDGVGGFYEMKFNTLRDEAGCRLGAFQMVTDVSERIRDQAALSQAHEQLRQSQKMEAVGQLTGGLAHDFNNLLAGISGSLELMQARIAQGRVGEVEKYVAAAQGAAQRAAALTHRLLAFSRRQTLDPRSTDVNRLVAGMEDLIRRTVGPGISLEAVASGGLWPTLVDPNQLENALLNLCINARDAMPNGGRITIETANRWLDERAARERDLPPGPYVSLCVADNGTGMPPEVVERAFDPFFTTKPIGVGTGLGLSMIYGFARQSGGQVRIDSQVGRGSAISLLLPRHHGEPEIAGDEEGAGDAPRAGAGETVLVVDDEPLVRMLVVDVLEDLGYAAIEAGDGAQGLAVLRSPARIDLLISDVGLPGGMNGRQMADAARVVRPDLKVLFVTGYAEKAVLGDGQLDPGMHVMTKPFSMEAMASRIRDLIASR